MRLLYQAYACDPGGGTAVPDRPVRSVRTSPELAPCQQIQCHGVLFRKPGSAKVCRFDFRSSSICPVPAWVSMRLVSGGFVYELITTCQPDRKGADRHQAIAAPASSCGAIRQSFPAKLEVVSSPDPRRRLLRSGGKSVPRGPSLPSKPASQTFVQRENRVS